jgi:hypothetical protein
VVSGFAWSGTAACPGCSRIPQIYPAGHGRTIPESESSAFAAPPAEVVDLAGGWPEDEWKARFAARMLRAERPTAAGDGG